MAKEILFRLAAQWKNSGLTPARGLTEKDLREFQAGNNVVFPVDFREYLLKVNGLRLGWQTESDENGFCFWPLERICSVPVALEKLNTKKEYSFSGDSEYFVFADYLDWSWAYAIRLLPDPAESGKVIIVGLADGPAPVAQSFSEFLDLYLSGSPKLYPRPTSSPACST